MAKQDGLTIFQKLTKVFGFQGQLREPPQFNFDREELLKTDSKEDFERARLQAQQKQYLADKWSKLDMSLYNQSVYYEPNRLSAYYDFESMEFTPEISAALDIYAEESCLSGDVIIPLLNGEKISIQELYNGHQENFWVYGIDLNNDKIIPAKIEKVIYKGKKDVYLIKLDDNTEIKCTEDHLWLTSQNEWIETKNLKFGTSLKSIYDKLDHKGYEKISLDNKNFKYTHRIVAESQLFEEKKKLSEKNHFKKERIIIHHTSFNKLNNSPEYLEYMYWNDHQKLHTDLNSERWKDNNFSIKMKKIFSETAKNTWRNKRDIISKKYSKSISNHMRSLTKSERILKYGRKKEQNGMFGVHRFGDLNPNYNKNKQHFKDIDEQEYINIVLQQTGNYRPILVSQFNLTKQSIIKFNKFLCKKYHLQRIEDIKFYFIPGYSIELIKNFMRSTKSPVRKKREYCIKYNIKTPALDRFIRKRGYKDWSDINKSINNHRIVDIKYAGKEDVFDLLNSSADSTFGIKCKSGMIISHNCTKSERGEILTIHSDSRRIKNILDDLFYNVLDINTNLPMWARGMCKYGDDFVYLKIDPEKGIIGCQQLPNIEVERMEGARQSVPNQSDRVGSRFPTRELRFTWKNKDMEFQAWEIAHFRILGDDRKLPYGTCLKSDSYIKTEKGYKEIKDIQIGDLVYSFDTLKQTPILSKVLDTVKSGSKICYKISTKHNYIDASEEHKILYYDQNDQDFKYKNTLDFKVGDLLVIDPKNSNNDIIYIDKTKPENCRNGYWRDIDYVPDIITKEFAELFGFLLGDGWITNNAVYIALGVHKTINEKYINYLQKFSNKTVKFHGGKDNDSQGICNSKMLKTVLQRLGFEGNVYTKRIPKWVFSSSYEIRKSFLNGLIDSDGSSNIDEWNCMRYSIELSNEYLINDIKLLVQSLGWKSGKISSRIRKNGYIGDRKFKSQKRTYYFYFYESEIRQKIKYDINNRISNDFIIEPIISIENIGEHDTYDIYVENEHHNFYANGIVVHNSMLDKIRRIWKQLLLAEDAMLIYRTSRAPERRVFKVFVGNMDDKDIEAYVQKIANKFKRDQVVDQKTGNVDMRYNQMAVDQDYFIPVRDQSQPSPIETLPGAQNLGEIADIEYIQKKMLAALRIPKAFLGFEDVIGNGKGLALLDIRFARTINRIQMSLIQELNKIALVHLFLLGLEDELNNFTLMLTNPSGQSDLLRIESWKEKITMYKDATSDQSQMGILPVSHTWAKKNILGMSDNEIILDLQQQRLERAMGIELQNTGMIIRRSGVFDDVDKKYGIPEAERKKIESAPPQTAEGGPMTGGGGGGMPVPPTEGAAVAPEAGGGEPPLSESKKQKILSMLNEDTTIDDLFDMEKAQRNIYEIENKLKDILNQ